jgi:hypothetical protein
VAQKALQAQPDPMRGSVRLLAPFVPDGAVRITRTVRNVPEVIRDGEFDSLTSGFIREDPEPPFGVPVRYRATLEVVNRHIQSNRVLNPRFALGTANWTTGTGRTLTRETAAALAPPRDAATSVRVSPAGVTDGSLGARTLVSTAPSGFGAGRWWFCGQARYDNPDLWLWTDVSSGGRTWQGVRDVGTWQQVRSKSAPAADQPFATLWAAVLSPTGTEVVPPFQVLGVTAESNEDWKTFQAWVTVPATAPANSRLVLLQGTLTREYATTWWVSTVMVTPEAEVTAGAVGYFDGDSPLPSNPAANLVPGYDWVPSTPDASMTWNGTPHASVSIYTGPSIIAASDTVTVLAPDRKLTRAKLPVFLSDPVTTQVGLWFELLGIGDLSFKARAELYDIIGKGPQIAISNRRAWPSGELRLMTKTLDQAALAERMFDPGRILFYRNPDPRFPESEWYLHIGDTASGRPGEGVAWAPERIWSVPFVRVERPIGLIETASSVPWVQVRDSMTWAELRDSRRDWLDAAVTPP